MAFSITFFVIFTYEALLRFAFWGPYALKKINTTTLATIKGHKKIDSLVMGGLNFLELTKRSFMYSTISFFTFIWSNKALIELGRK